MLSRAFPLLFAAIALFALLGVANSHPMEERDLEARARTTTTTSHARTTTTSHARSTTTVHRPSAVVSKRYAQPTAEPFGAREWTNAKRMAAGLGPRAPRTTTKSRSGASATVSKRFARATEEPVEARDLEARARTTTTTKTRARTTTTTSHARTTTTHRPSATISKRAPSATPSGSTVQTFSGRIAVRSNTFIGYVSGGSPARVDAQGKYGGDLEIQFTTNTATSTPVNLQATNGGFSPTWIGGSGDEYLSAHSSAIVPITNVPATLAYVKPTSEGASSIWVFDNESYQLTPRWTNIDGGAPSIVIGYNWQSNQLFLTGDLSVYNAATGSQAIQVEFYLSN